MFHIVLAEQNLRTTKNAYSSQHVIFVWIMMCCEYFTEICQINNFSTFQNALNSNGFELNSECVDFGFGFF